MNDAHDDLVLGALAKHFEAQPDKLWPDPNPGHRVSCALYSARATGRPWHTLATYGMSRAPMVMDARATDTDTARTELVAYVDQAEASPDDLASLLGWTGRLPFQQPTPTFLGWGHTIPVGRALFAQSLLTTVFTLIPVVRPDKGTIFHVGSEPVSLLWTTFLTDAEYALKKARGENAVLDLFAANKHPVPLARSRPSYV